MSGRNCGQGFGSNDAHLAISQLPGHGICPPKLPFPLAPGKEGHINSIRCLQTGKKFQRALPFNQLTQAVGRFASSMLHPDSLFFVYLCEHPLTSVSFCSLPLYRSLSLEVCSQATSYSSCTHRGQRYWETDRQVLGSPLE